MLIEMPGSRRERWEKRWWRRLIVAIAFLYPVCILAVTIGFRFIGERWWVTGVGLYAPRYVFAAPLPVVVLALAATPSKRRLLWTQAASLVLLLFPLMGFVVPRPHFARRDPPTMRVLSYNIAGAMGGVENVLREIDRFSPDVVILQEVGSADAINAFLEARYASVRITGQFLIATRYPVVSSFEPEPFLFRGQRHSPRFFKQVLDTPLGRIAVYDVHPVSPREGFYALFSRGMKGEVLSGRLFTSPQSERFMENARLRAGEVQALAEALAGEAGPVLIAGDTNLPGLSPILNANLSRYQDGFVQAGAGFGYTYPTNHGIPWMRIDRVLAGPELRFVGFQSGSSLASDHLCVIADVERASS
jgi:vancomycin resistance protein VanJ